MFIISIFIIVSASCVITSHYYNTVVNPLMIFIVVNVFSIVLALLYSPPISIISDTVRLDVVIMLVSFLIGNLLACSKKAKKKVLNKRNLFPRLRKLIIIISSLYNVATILYFRKLFQEYSITQFFLELSSVNVYVQSEEFNPGLLPTLFLPLGTPLSILILYYCKGNGWKTYYVVQYIVSFLHCISPRRAPLFTFILINALYFFLCNRKDEVNKIRNRIVFLCFIFLAVILMSISQVILAKSANDSIVIAGIKMPEFVTDPYMYIASNYPYLSKIDIDLLINRTEPFHATLRLVYRYLCNGVDTETLFELDFLDYGYGLTNTAPLLYYSYMDLGSFFFIDFVILGFIARYAYCAIFSEKITNILFGLFFYGLLVMSFRQYDVIFLNFHLTMIYIYLMNQYLYRK